jgi:gamma-glutamyltranspeptidase / glutathione hydrolase
MQIQNQHSNMKIFKLLFFFIAIIFACKTNKKSKQLTTETKVEESTGFYQFLNEDPNASPFFAKKEGVFADNGMVASAHPEASKVGVAILKAGGNAIDAAVAISFALGVVHPAAGNIGGGGFLVYRDEKGNNYSLDYREKAPAEGTRNMYLDKNGDVINGLSLNGHLASGTPGSVDGLVQMHQKFGKMPWAKLVEPAINLAINGVKLTEREARGLNRIKAELESINPGKKYFIKQDGTEWKENDLLIQTDLGQTLTRIKEKGRAGFYEGKTAELLLNEMDEGCGIISQKDLDNYKAQWREPIKTAYKNYKIIGMPPPSSGGIAMAQLMEYIENYPLQKWGWHADSTTQIMIEAERRVFADRSKWLGDPDFVKVPVNDLLDEAYLKNRFKDFNFAKATDSKMISPGTISGHESMETTHFSVVDKQGNAVAITTTLNNSYGSKVVVEGAGFFMNDEMDDFSVKPGTPNIYGLIGYEANSIRPNKRMLSSMTPTIVEKDGKLFLVVGTPGGSTIITSVFQVVVNVIEHKMGMQEAVDALRFHHQWLPDKIMYEKGAFSEKTLLKLIEKGYKMEMQKNTIGRMDCIMLHPNGKLEGGSDVRSDDTSIGY